MKRATKIILQSCHAKASINKSLLYAVHWDGKKIKSYKNESENRIVIVITGPGKEILLECPQLVKTSGKCQADAVFSTIKENLLKENIIAMSFDTTNSNFSIRNGVAVLLEKFTEMKLLYLPCRHHIIDLSFQHGTKKCFGGSVGPSSPIFDDFRNKWDSLDKDSARLLTLDDEWLRDIAQEVVATLKMLLIKHS